MEEQNKSGLKDKMGNAKARLPKFSPVEKLKKTSKKQKAAVTAVALATVIGVSIFSRGLLLGEAEASSYTEYTVSRGSIQTTISGSAMVEPINQYDVVSVVQGEVLADTFEEGDTVEKGDTLYVIDSEDMQLSLEKANISVEKSNMSYSSTLDEYNGLNVTAGTSGKVTEILVNRGEMVNSGTQIAKVVDDSAMTVKVPFSTGDASGIYTGQSAVLTVENTFEQLSGTVTKVYNNQRVLDGYVTVSDVEITVANPGALTNGTYVTASVGGVYSYEGGTMEGRSEKLVTSKTSGIVSQIHVSEGEQVSSSSVLISLENDSASDTLKNSQLSLRESQLSYESTAKQLENYTITAPISGSIIEKTVKAGDTIDNTSSNVTMAVIADMSTMIIKISVDELDVAEMQEGQEVSITVDALSDQEFTGYVDNIGINGTASSGVTTYPVTIVINDPVDIWPGMNATAEIVVDSTENALIIPVGAVTRGSQVLVEESYVYSGTSSSAANTAGFSDSGGFSDGGTLPDGDGFPGGGSLTDGDNLPDRDSFPDGNGLPGADSLTDGDGFPDGGSFPDGGVEPEPSEKGDAVDKEDGEKADSPPSSQENQRSIQSDAPEGYKYVTVELGLNDSNYIEVLSGLDEGTTILVPVYSGTSDSGSAEMTMTMDGGAMPGGGMPNGGGMPGGGGSGSGMPGGGGSGGGMPGGGGPGGF